MDLGVSEEDGVIAEVRLGLARCDHHIEGSVRCLHELELDLVKALARRVGRRGAALRHFSGQNREKLSRSRG